VQPAKFRGGFFIMMKLILIRHGSTNYNLKKRYCGFKDISLNKIGKVQAKKIKHKTQRLKIDKVFCSDLKRSWQTAQIIFSDRKCPIIKNANLREINFGEWEGLNFKQVSKIYPSIYKKWLKNPFCINIPDGEKIRHFVKRIKKELKNIIKGNPHKTVAIVGHAGLMRVMLNTALGVKEENFWKLYINPQTIYIIRYDGKLRPKVYKL
jgi:alpha-ribazole phosphatase